MKLHANAALSLKGRRELCRRVVSGQRTVTEAAEAAEVSVRCARKWVAWYRAEGEAGLRDRSSAPHRIPHRTSQQRVDAIAALRRLRFTGPEIADVLGMPLSTVSGILQRIGMGKLGRVGLEPAVRCVRFERYCDDVIVHASSERQARMSRDAVARRLAECGLELNEHKTHIVSCKDADRRGSHEHESFTFLGYTFRPRLARSKRGNWFVSFLPAIGNDERKRIGRVIRRWRLHRRSGSTLTDLAKAVNAEVRGWINFYGRFYRSELNRLLRRINEYLVRSARWKYKRLRRYPAKARRLLAAVYRRDPDLFAHWRFGVRPDGWTMGAG